MCPNPKFICRLAHCPRVAEAFLSSEALVKLIAKVMNAGHVAPD